MFLSLAFGILVVQIGLILFLTLPVPIRLRRVVINGWNLLFESAWIRTGLTILVIIVFGLFAENMITTFKYSEYAHHVSDTFTSTVVANGKHEIYLKLLRAQRNMYLTFCVNFNWIILYSLAGLISKIGDLEHVN